jgi:hypothetical protein
MPPVKKKTTAKKVELDLDSMPEVVNPRLECRIYDGEEEDPVVLSLVKRAKAGGQVTQAEIQLLAELVEQRSPHRSVLDVVALQEMIGWETESQFNARMLALLPEAKRSTVNYTYGDQFDFRNTRGEKVRCWHNEGNRPFMRDHALSLAQDILTLDWADSRNGGTIKLRIGKTASERERDPECSAWPDASLQEFSEMTVNGETIIISRTGRTSSGQHRIIGAIFAHELWEDSPKDSQWRKNWPKGPTLQTVVFVGVSDSPRVIRTLDNVAPRTEADTLVTVGVYDSYTEKDSSGNDKPLDAQAKKELSKGLAAGLDVLWRRVKAGGKGSGTLYKTLSASHRFRERHPTLEKLMWHIYVENRRRGLSIWKLSPGGCAAMAYLFGASNTSPEKYFGLPLEDRSEAVIDWTEKITPTGLNEGIPIIQAAELFFSLLAGGDAALEGIGEEITRLTAIRGTSPPTREKEGILCTAWNLFSQGAEVREDPPWLTYVTDDKTGETKAIELPTVGGIDVQVDDTDGEAASREEVEANKVEEERKKREQMTSEVRERQANKMPTTLHEKRIADFKNNSRK